jgi:predicted dehydrogenase/threonine dehydrogenase-like Zn-dependent dehydrogenase
MWVKGGMKQVIQSRRSGKLALKDVPEPQVKAGHILVRTRASLISAGTERMVVDFAKKSLAGKAKARPDLVKKVIDKARRDGLKSTFQTVMARLDEPLPLGYSATGDVVAVGVGLEGVFRVGERVAIAGAGLANHAELNVVPRNLAAPVPEGVTDAEASFGTLGAIALHAVRNLEAGLGDTVAVIGLGLVGQLAAQFLSLSGVRVIGLDYDPARLDLARANGMEAAINPSEEDTTGKVHALTKGRGCDGILIAAATSSSEPFQTAADIARDRARVSMVGLTGTEFPYADFMKKELNIIISRSYGPGRYDPDFEGRNVKYPEGWVRWTETENLAECLRLMAPDHAHRLDVSNLISHRMDLDDAEQAYAMITGGTEPHMGVVLTYSGQPSRPAIVPASVKPSSGCILGVIGAGSFAKSVLLPEFRKISGVTLHTLATQRGATADHGKETFGFLNGSANSDDVLNNPDINTVLIATRHDSHAQFTAKALANGKSVWVEKPLALDRQGLNQVIEARNSQENCFFQVGFNRRFAPMAERVRTELAKINAPKVMMLRINAGAIEGDHWVHAGDEGGGRILGEVCHFIDLARFFAGSPITSVQAEAARAESAASDDVSISLAFADGSLASILYTALGDSSSGKERFEIFSGGRNMVIEDFRHLQISGSGKAVSEKAVQDKGFKKGLRAFTDCVISGGPAPIDEEELIETGFATIAVLESLQNGTKVIL